MAARPRRDSKGNVPGARAGVQLRQLHDVPNAALLRHVREGDLLPLRALLQGPEVRAKYSLDLGDPVGVEKGFMTKGDDRFRFSAIKVAACIGDHAIGSCVHRTRNFLTDDAMKGNCRRNRGQGHQRGTIGRERAN
jgi:hypothetical protein